MKRSKHVYLNKKPQSLKRGVQVSAVAAGAYMLSGCGSSETAHIYENAQECTYYNPSHGKRCEAAYQRALQEWQDTAPRYRSIDDCVYDFGFRQCEEYRPYFIPLMAGFMLGNNYQTYDDDFDLDFDRPKPLTSSRNKGSSAYGRWVGANGTLFGSSSKSQVKVGKSTFNSSSYKSSSYKNSSYKNTKGSAKVLGRGGFGKSISSRSFGG